MIKRLILAFVLVLCMGRNAQSQTHKVILNWMVGTSGSTYKIYRGPCGQPIVGTTQPNGAVVGTCPSLPPTFSVVGTSTATTFTDSSVADNGLYVYEVTGSIQSVESSPTNAVGVSIPSNLVITSISIVHVNSSKDQITVKWTDTPGTQTGYTLFGVTAVLKIGNGPGNNGAYSATWSGIPQARGVFGVCDILGACKSKSFVSN